MRVLEKSGRGRKVGRTAADRLQEGRVRDGVVELDRADPTYGAVRDIRGGQFCCIARVRFPSPTLPSSKRATRAKLTEIVVPPRELVVLRRPLRELRLADQPVRLLVQAVLEVVPEEEREERRLQVVVMAEGGGALRGEESTAMRAGERAGEKVVLSFRSVYREFILPVREKERDTHGRSTVESSPLSSCARTQ